MKLKNITKKQGVIGSLSALIIVLGFLIFLSLENIQYNQKRIPASENNQPYDRSRELRLDRPTVDGVPGSMMYVDVRDQGQYSNCYAEATIQMVDAYRFARLGEKNFNTKTSVMSLAIGYSEKKGNIPLFKGGNVKEAIKYILSDGVQSELAVLKCVVKNTNSQEVDDLMSIHNELYSTLAAKKDEIVNSGVSNFREYPIYKKFRSEIFSKYARNVALYLQSKGRSSQLIPSLGMIENLLEQPEFYFFWGISNYACVKSFPRTKLQIPNIEEASFINVSYEKFMNFIQLHFSKKEISMPTTISFCGSLLYDGKAYKGAYNAGSSMLCLKNTKNEESPGHATLIIGIRKNTKTGRDDFLIRNSWGKGCNTNTKLKLPLSIRAKYQSKWFPNESYDIYSKDWECDNGNLWIDAYSLYKSATALTYFVK